MSVSRFLNGISWWAWTVLLAFGAVMLVLGLGWFPLFAVIVGWLVAVLLRDDEPPEREGEPEVANLAGAPSHITKSALVGASNEELCEMWARSGAELRRAYLPSTITAHAAFRQQLLDEMQRRDPEAIDRWLADRPDQRDPRTYLGSP